MARELKLSFNNDLFKSLEIRQLLKLLQTKRNMRAAERQMKRSYRPTVAVPNFESLTTTTRGGSINTQSWLRTLI